MKTTVHYTAKGQKTHVNGQGKTVTTQTCFQTSFRHVGHLTDASARNLAEKHAARRQFALETILFVSRV